MLKPVANGSIYTAGVILKSPREFNSFELLLRYYKKMPKPKNNQMLKKEIKEINNSPFSKDKSGNVLLKILAKPGAKLNSITDVNEDGIGVQINAPPMEGEANAELIKYISQVLGLKKSNVTLEKGSKSRQKTLMISDSNLAIEEIESKIHKEIHN